MNLPRHTETIPERIACCQPGKALRNKVCTAVIAVIGIVAVPTAVWADYTGYNLNKVALWPRLLLAAVLILACIGVYRGVRESAVELRIDFYSDRLVLSYAALPGLWREGVRRQVAELPYKTLTGCVINASRQRVTLRSAGYTLTRGEEAPKQKTGVVSFSVLDARDLDFAGLMEKYTAVHVTRKT